jgi:glucose-6-phosphate 1-epimerase
LTAIDLQTRFGIPGALRFADTPSGLIRAIISGPQADATLYLQGAHVTEWTPRGQHPVLFTSSRSRFEPGIPIRGGIPIVFPWFGPRTGASMHGFARNLPWTLESAALRPDGAVELCLSLSPTPESRAAGYDLFHLQFRAVFGFACEIELKVHNSADSPMRFENAFHTYFAVGGIGEVRITGLEDTTYVDKTAASVRKQSEVPISITGETDQVHLNTTSTCEIHDRAWRRTIVVEKAGSNTTVVWNPWIEKNRSLSDMAPDDYQHMLCIETANALDNAVILPGGGIHQMRAAIRLQ